MEDAVNKLAKDDSFPAVPASSIPLREDQISNAIAFLSHAKVCIDQGLYQPWRYIYVELLH